MKFRDTFKCKHKGENVKITKLSLAAVAAMTLTTGAMAEVTSELSGNVKYWYETAEKSTGTGEGLFHKTPNGFTHGQAALSIEAKGKAGVLGYGFKYTAVDSLGLEDELVGNVRTSKVNPGTNFETAHWAEKAFITYKMGNTTAKVGRQHLNTPMAFTEAWNVAANSFDAAVLLNSDIENVTLMGAYVGRGNGGNQQAGNGFSTVRLNGEFTKYVVDGAYAAGIYAKPMKGLGLNAHYWNVLQVADALWLDANYAISGVKLGAVYAQTMPKATAGDDINALAIKAGTKAGPVNLFAAYSTIEEGNAGSIPFGNTATGFKKTKLPTAGVYSDGLYVAQRGSDSFKVKAAMPVGSFKLAAQYINVANDVLPGLEVGEFDFIASTKIKDVNVKAIYVNRDHELAGKADWDHVRIIAGINF
ncbi:MAG: Unknown protein [uncultured Sulfurovum sp.]|uniref:Uncharacterized protein n=1 Tax=uncultured Sulfurovum sp. TaxID=269237 RepID=A0A6S6SZX2_9BACT|nr:MAG: Unknown protein [uncultured Sulfurovum sp.]